MLLLLIAYYADSSGEYDLKFFPNDEDQAVEVALFMRMHHDMAINIYKVDPSTGKYTEVEDRETT